MKLKLNSYHYYYYYCEDIVIFNGLVVLCHLELLTSAEKLQQQG